MACPCIAHGAQGAIVASARRQAALAAPNAGILVRGRPHRALAASAPRSTFAGALRAAAASPAEAPQAGRTSVGTPATTARKTRVVVLGSGWGAVAFIKNIDAAAFAAGGPYELVLVSPRNHMVYTPLLPSAVGGVVSESSIVEPIRNILGSKGTYYEAECTDIDPATRTLTCVKQYCEVCAARRAALVSLGSQDHTHTEADHTISIPYDILLCSVGAVNATFGIQGVREHCWFLKSMEDAQKLRRHIGKALELAALPGASAEERKRLLSFVVVGGGPTGVELAAELHDLVAEDVARVMPHIKDDVSITLINGTDSLLNSYHTEIQTYAGEVFSHSGIQLHLGARVTRVREGQVEVELKDGSSDAVPFGTCVWATGIAMHPLVASLKAKLPVDAQTSGRGLVVDAHLRVLGTRGTIFCIGDAAVAGPAPSASLPPTAQVARQEGEFLAALLSKHALAPAAEPAAAAAADDVVPIPAGARPFSYLHLGSLAYLGSRKGAMDLPFKLPFLKTLRGYLGGASWRTLETMMQVSLRTRWLVAHDWLRSALWGRNISDI